MVYQKLQFTLLCVAIIAASAFAQDNAFENWDPHFQQGDISYSAAIGVSPWWGRTGLSLTPGMEFIFSEYRVGETVPLSFGVAAMGNISTDIGDGFSDLGVTVAGLATAHLGFKNVSEPLGWLSNFDLYFRLGLSYDIIRPDWFGNGRLRFASIQGANYFITETFAVLAESSHLGRYRNYLTLGVLWKV